MPTTTLRQVKGLRLTHAELDANFAEKVAQAVHGFAVGDLVYPDATAWAKAQADSAAKRARGVVVAVPDANTFYAVCRDGSSVLKTAHGLGARGTRLWLSQSAAGAWTATQPSSGILQEVGVVLDANTILFDRTGHLEI